MSHNFCLVYVCIMSHLVSQSKNTELCYTQSLCLLFMLIYLHVTSSLFPLAVESTENYLPNTNGFSEAKKKKKKHKRSHHHNTEGETQTAFRDKDYCILSEPKEKTRLSHLIHTEVDPNGGASVLHVYSNEIENLSEEKMRKFVKLFLREVFTEENQCTAKHVMGIVHGAVSFLPEFVDYFGKYHPNVTVKTEQLGKKSDLETVKMSEFVQRLQSSYCNGTYRAGPLLQFSLVGTVQEEVGGYFPEILQSLEECPFLKETMPWGNLSILKMDQRQQSNDGPILWVRPGEQHVPTAEMCKSPYKKRRCDFVLVIL